MWRLAGIVLAGASGAAVACDVRTFPIGDAHAKHSELWCHGEMALAGYARQHSSERVLPGLCANLVESRREPGPGCRRAGLSRCTAEHDFLHLYELATTCELGEGVRGFVFVPKPFDSRAKPSISELAAMRRALERLFAFAEIAEETRRGYSETNRRMLAAGYEGIDSVYRNEADWAVHLRLCAGEECRNVVMTLPDDATSLYDVTVAPAD
jgi:hypothetical protein